MESFCRLCSTSHKIAKLNNLFEKQNSLLSEKLNHFVGSAIIVYVKDILYICIRCTELLEAAYEFKLICESADARFSAVSQSSSRIVKEEVVCRPDIEIVTEENRDEYLGFKYSHSIAKGSCKNDDGMESPKLHSDNESDLTDHMSQTNEPTSKLGHDNNNRNQPRKRPPRGSRSCEICSTSFCIKRELDQHMKTVHQQLVIDEKPSDDKRSAWICESCGREYKSKKALKYHIDGAHVEVVVKNYSCDLCDYKCREARNLVSHRLVHSDEKRYQCSECGKSFGFRPSLARHILCVHKREKRHKCHICNQSFYSTFRLKEHSFVHTGEHPLQCKICSRTYRYNNSLLKHMRKRHQDVRKQKEEMTKS